MTSINALLNPTPEDNDPPPHGANNSEEDDVISPLAGHAMDQEPGSPDSCKTWSDPECHILKKSPRSPLSITDLILDYDDPRPPGQVSHPRLCNMNKRYQQRLRKIGKRPPASPPRRSMMNKEFLVQEALKDPLHVDHSYYVCLQKGRHGAPTYDPAGFELDYGKVEAWEARRKTRRNEPGFDLKAENALYGHIRYVYYCRGSLPQSASMRTLFLNVLARDVISKASGVPYHEVDLQVVDKWAAWARAADIPKRDYRCEKLDDDTQAFLQRMSFRYFLRK